MDKNGKLQAFRLPSCHYRIDKSDFKQFLEAYNNPIKEWLFEPEADNGKLISTEPARANTIKSGDKASSDADKH